MILTNNINTWYKVKVEQEHDLITPSLLIYPNRIERNIQKMVSISGNANNLRPHIKTHKMTEIIEIYKTYGVSKFKCATIAEAELLARCNAKDILLSMQPVGIQIERFFLLIKKYPNTSFSTIVDHQLSVKNISHKAEKENIKVDLWLDLNNGMHRTGVFPNQIAFQIVQEIIDSKSLNFKGLHVYDGHVNQSDLKQREKICNKDYAQVETFIELLYQKKIKTPIVVAGGTPTFPVHSKRIGVESSPGTPPLWDAGYSSKFQDLNFEHAAILATRVVSHPTSDSFCLDLGHKSVASEMTLPRVNFLNIDYTEQLSQSEEHLVVKKTNGELPKVGTLIYAIPMHICPTVVKYSKAYTVENNKLTGSWAVAARDHKITI